MIEHGSGPNDVTVMNMNTWKQEWASIETQKIQCIWTDRLGKTVKTQSDTTGVASDQGLHCLPFVHQSLDRLKGSKMQLFKF